MKFDILTLFPDMVKAVLSESIIGRATEAGYLDITCHNIRDYTESRQKRVDDTPYGGGMGMLLQAQPLYDCFHAVLGEKKPENCRVVYMSPQGRVLTQRRAGELARLDRLVILCGHYEGVDERVLEEFVDEEISVGDYVLTGGEIPACLLVDCVGRLIDGVLADKICHEEESISCGMLEYPQYTKPAEFRGRRVPEVLLNGNHKEIEKWRFETALARTKKKRPDLI